MESDTGLLSLIQEAAKAYDDADALVERIDEYCDKISGNQQKVDMILSDLYHEIENDDLTDQQLATFGKEIKKYRKIRRNIDNENIIRNIYEKHKLKLSSKENRPFFRNSMKQVLGDLNQPYKNRVLTDDDIDQLKKIINLDDSKEKKLTKAGEKRVAIKKRKCSSKIDIQELKKEWLKGKTQKELAIMFNCTQPTINYYIKKIKEEGNK